MPTIVQSGNNTIRYFQTANNTMLHDYIVKVHSTETIAIQRALDDDHAIEIARTYCRAEERTITGCDAERLGDDDWYGATVRADRVICEDD